MKLYYAETMNPRKACVTAKYLKSPVEYVRVDLATGEHKQPAHLARNPNGRVPVLEDGASTLWESMAIMARLALHAGSDLWPVREPARQVEVLRWLSWDLCEWMPQVGTYYFERIIKPAIGLGAPDPAQMERVNPALHEAAKVLDAQLADHAYVAGDKLSLADFCIGVLLPYSRECEFPLSGYSHIQRWHAELMKLDAWRNPWPAA